MKKLARTFVLILLVISVIFSNLIFVHAAGISSGTAFATALANGGQINIIDDFNWNTAIEITKSVTINGNGNTLTGKLVFAGDGEIKLNNVNLVGPSNVGDPWQVKSNPKLTISGGSMTSNGSNSGDAILWITGNTGTGAVITLKDGVRFDSTAGQNMCINMSIGCGGKLVIEDAEMRSRYYGIRMQGNIGVEFLGGSLTVIGTPTAIEMTNNSNTNLVIGKSDGTGPTVSNTSAGQNPLIDLKSTNVTSTVIRGGTVINNCKAGMFNLQGKATLAIEGGSFNVNPTAYVDTAIYDVTEKSGVWTVAMPDGDSITTEGALKAALDAGVKEIAIRGTITLSSELNITKPVIITGGTISGRVNVWCESSEPVIFRNITLENSATTLDARGSSYIILDGMVLTSSSTSKENESLYVHRYDSTYPGIEFTGVIDVIGGTVIERPTQYYIINVGVGAKGVINVKYGRLNGNSGDSIVIQGGTEINLGGEGENVELNLYGDGFWFKENSSAIINVYEGATIVGNNTGVNMNSSGNPVLNVYGGSITTKNDLFYTQQSATINIYDGTLNAGANEVCYAKNSSNATKVNIYGGDINSTSSTKFDVSSASKVIICGGEFNFDPKSYVDTNQYKITNNGTKWIVSEKFVQSGIGMLITGGDGNKYSFKVELKANTTYRFSYNYRTTGTLPMLSIKNEDYILSVREKENQTSEYLQIYHITTDNFNTSSMEYTFELEFAENTNGVGVYIDNIELYQLKNNQISGDNMLVKINPEKNQAVVENLIEDGQSMAVELNPSTETDGWYGKFGTNQDDVSKYAKYIKFPQGFFEILNEEQSNFKAIDLRNLLLGKKKADLILNYDEYCDGVITLQDLLRIKKAKCAEQTPSLLVGEELSNIKPDELPAINFGTVSSYVQEDRYIKLINNATLSNYNTYVKTLKNNGFIEYDSNQVDGCWLTTLVNETTTVTIKYAQGKSSILLFSEPKTDLYTRQKDNVYTEINMQSLFTGMKNQNSPIYSGMGFIIRLSDGRFIVIDGGGGDYNSVDSNNILNILKEQSPEGTAKPVIAAWILTHAHDDHIGAFNAFTMDFYNKVTIESFYFNFPTTEIIGNKTAGMSHDKYYSYPNFLACVEKYPEAKVVRPHGGERYYIGNAVIDMLFSYEDLYPSRYEDGSLGDFNHTSLVFKINIGGQDMLITADATTDSMKTLNKIYGSFLQSDILQMAHHGQNGIVDFYSVVNPQYALMPVSHVDTTRITYNEANVWLKNSSKVRQFISFWSSNVTIPLPYNPNDSEIYTRIPTSNSTYKDYSYLY